jgi:uncharacterized protein
MATRSATLTVVSLHRFPVKSMQGESVDAVDVDEKGIVGDRRWGLRDKATGYVLTGRRVPALLEATGRHGAVTLPDGETTADSRKLSSWLKREVELIGTADSRSTYEVPLDPLDGETQWVSWQGPTGSFVDSTKTAISLVSTATLQTWEPRRFRLNVQLSGAEIDDEVRLVGHRVRIGEVELDIVKRVDRCVMVTRAQPGFERDLDVLKAINHRHEGNLGVGGLVRRTGTIAIGDTVEVIGSILS